MPVSDFICEYCSCVIIPEEQAATRNDEIEQRMEEHKTQLKREHQRKLQLDDETLMVARDVRVLRQRRKIADDEATGAWLKVQEAIQNRQRMERKLAELRVCSELASMTKAQGEELRSSLSDQVAAARKQRDALQIQLQARQARLAGAEADLDPEEELRKAAAGKSNQVRRMSFGKKDKDKEAAAGGEVVRKPSFGKGTAVGRVLSFGKKKKDKPDGGAGGDGSKRDSAADGGAGPSEEVKAKTGSITGSLVRKLSFGRKK